MQLEPNLHRIGSDMVNAYLVAEETGLIMIDAGLPGHWDELLAELESMDRGPHDISALILTHGDSDHLGVAERLRRDHGVEVIVHEKDAPQVRGETSKKNPSWGRVRVGPLLSFLWYAGRKGGMKIPSVSEVTTVEGGETLGLPGEPRVIHIPGHSPGSIAIHVPAVGALFVGDALTTRHVLTGETGPRPAPFTLDEAKALDSLVKLKNLETRWVLPGHGPPWRGGMSDVVDRIGTVVGTG
jgi:glyoxylase-like metal-dependent hydrolase (beta-lactamase superfamily II)